jgi:CRISPR/Cas system-associated exonuclease Cas4 (RecB family)
MGLTREELYRQLSVISDGPVDIETITKKAMVEYENKFWREDLGNHPATSFWASNFPGTENKCCNTRGLLYTLMNIPHNEPIPPKLRGQSEMGNAVEKFVLDSWDRAGILLGSQIKFKDEETWLTGAADAFLDLRPDYRKLIVVDIKSKDSEVIQAMRTGTRTYDPKHYLQLQSYFYLCDKLMDIEGIEWELGKPVGGILYYVSRQDPTFVKEYYIDMDKKVIDELVEVLKELKNNFINGTLPPVPDGHKWSEPPARWCRFKKECCKKDWKEGTTELCESNGIEFAKFLRPGYNYEEIREKVLEKWSENF